MDEGVTSMVQKIECGYDRHEVGKMHCRRSGFRVGAYACIRIGHQNVIPILVLRRYISCQKPEKHLQIDIVQFHALKVRNNHANQRHMF